MVFLGQRFNTFEEFERAKEEYEIKQHVPYTVFNCYLATSYNKNVAPEKRMPEDMKWKEATIACTHYGKPRTSKHVEGKKKRNNQSTLKRFCTAKFNLNYSVLGKYLYVSKITEEHCNHQQSAENAKHYSRNRRPPAETIKKVEEMLGHEVKTHIIREEVLSCGVIATGQDLQNMRNKFLTSLKGAGQTAIEALMEQLKKLGDDDPGSVWEITHDENTKLISSVFFQTSYMRVALDKYPEVMLMDTTYNLSDNEMPLTVFEVVDCFGRGRIAGYALILSERTDVLCAALSGLKKACKKLDQVHVVYVDKSQAEISCIPSVFPNAEVHLCDFHVKKIFERKDVRRLCTKWNELEPVLERLRFAYSKEEYNKHYEELKTIAGGPDSNFMKYFDKNWHNNSLVWSDYQRNRTFTLGERTTSRLESHNAKIKKLINKKLPPAEVIFRLRVLDRNMKLENEHRVFNETVKTKYHKYSDDPILQEILRVNTPFVGKLLQKEYDKSLQPPSNTKHVVTTETCDCAYFQKFKLVCAHIFRERRLKGVHVYDHSLVPERWLLIVPSDNVQKNFENFEIIAAPIKVPKVKKVMSHEDRYTLVDNITKRICSIIANHAGDEYHHYVNVLKNMEDLLRLGKRVAVVGINKDGSAEHTAMDQSVIHFLPSQSLLVQMKNLRKKKMWQIISQ